MIYFEEVEIFKKSLALKKFLKYTENIFYFEEVEDFGKSLVLREFWIEDSLWIIQ